MFKQAEIWLRNREIYDDTCFRLGRGEKRDIAYDDVAREYGVSRSVVVKAFSDVQQRLKAWRSDNESS